MSDGAVRLGVRQVGEVQERAARAVPASVHERAGGTWLRYVDTPATWWAGATLLHGAGTDHDLSGGVDLAEAFYAAHGALPTFQVCPACPADLDDELTRRGYGWGPVVSLQAAPSATVAQRAGGGAPRVALAEQPGASWFDVLLGGVPAVHAAAERRLVGRVELPSAYATASLDGRAVAVGRAVADSGWAGVFSMVTRPDARRLGAASAVLAGLAGWAVDRGCARLYLQVTRDSDAALALYAGAGFAEVSRYHYRVAVPG